MKNFYKRLLGVVVLAIFPVSSFGFCTRLIFDSPQVILSDIPFSPPKNSWLLDPRNRKQTIDISGTGISSSEMFIIVDNNVARINSLSYVFLRATGGLTGDGILSDPVLVKHYLPSLVKSSTDRGYQAAVSVIRAKTWGSAAGHCIGDWELDSLNHLSVSMYIFVTHYNRKFPPELDRVYQFRLKFIKPDAASIYLLDDVQSITPAQARLAAR
jgi:hypothetical protein